jgi:hypothetical protein
LLPSDVFPVRGSHSPWGYQPQVRALSAFLTLSGPYSASHLPALFHAGPALGVSPFEAKSTRRAVRPLERPYPHAVHVQLGHHSNPLGPTSHQGTCQSKWAVNEAALRAFCATSGLCSLRASVSSARLFRPCGGPRPPWASSSLGVSPSSPVTP